MRSSLQLEQKVRIGATEFKEINCLHLSDGFFRCVLSSILKFFNNSCPEYFNETYFPAETCKINTGSFFKGSKQPLTKTNKDLKRSGKYR